MKKVLVIGGLFVAAVVFALAIGFNSSVASPEIGQTPVDLSQTLMPGADQAQPMAECAKIECGMCPGPKCKIDGICCYVPDSNGAKSGLAHCGCTAEGEPVCKCEVGVPR